MKTATYGISLSLAKKIQVKISANEDDSLSDLEISATVVISIVFSSWIINEFNNVCYLQKGDIPVHLRGRSDVLVYRGVMGFTVIGLGITFYGIFLMATNQMEKKPK